MLPVLQIGPLAIQTPGLILLLGIWIGLWLSERHVSRHNLEASHLYNIVMTAILFGLVGGRFFFVLRYPEAFIDSPASILSINLSLFDLSGAMLVGIIAAFVYGGRKKLPFWMTLDALTPGLATFAISLALANLASGSGFGAPSQVPWAIELWGARRHPTQIYEFLAAALILFLIVYLQRSTQTKPPGYIFLLFIALSAGARLFLEGFRGDSPLLANGFRMSQVIAWLVLAASLWLISRQKTSLTRSAKETMETDFREVG
jgi:phosphatidylglycerol---prolipoprotein diacylglyceryl transferase